MAKRGRQSFEKGRLAKQRQERQAAKRERRLSGDAEAGDAPDETELMERFRLLSERHAAGEIDDNTYETRRREIFVALGLEEEDDDED